MGIIVVEPEQPWYDAICCAQLALIAACVDGLSSVPSLAHFCWPYAQSKYVWNRPPHLESPTRPSHWLTSLAVGGVSLGQRPFAVQLTFVPPPLEQPSARQRATAVKSTQARAPMDTSLPDARHSVEEVALRRAFHEPTNRLGGRAIRYVWTRSLANVSTRTPSGLASTRSIGSPTSISAAVGIVVRRRCSRAFLSGHDGWWTRRR